MKRVNPPVIKRIRKYNFHKNIIDSSGSEISSDEEQNTNNYHCNSIHKYNIINPIPIWPKASLCTEQCSIISRQEAIRSIERSKAKAIQRYGKLTKIQAIQKKNQMICSICINDISTKKLRQLGKLECGHVFCIECILASSKFSNKCPYCRRSYQTIANASSTIIVQNKQFEQQENYQDQPCYVCGRNDDFNQLLVCDHCNFSCCHTYCDVRLRGSIPGQIWYCLSCQRLVD